MRKLIIIILISGLSFGLHAQIEKIQASYIYQFTKLISWCPTYKSGDFVIGVIGNSPLTKELAAFKGKAVANQLINVKTYNTVDEIDKCNILFVPETSSKLLPSVNRKIGGKCTLVISEKEGLIKNGSSINFLQESGKVLFEINVTTVGKHSLVINSRLLTMAKTVYKIED